MNALRVPFAAECVIVIMWPICRGQAQFALPLSTIETEKNVVVHRTRVSSAKTRHGWHLRVAAADSYAYTTVVTQPHTREG